jgi:sporulation protein YlmC with PRC-barrel domain
MKGENGDLLADSHRILIRWKNYSSQLLNVCRISEIMHMEIYTAEPSMHELILEVKISVAKLTRYNSEGVDQIPAELIQAIGEILLSKIRKLIYCLSNGRSLLQY